MCYDCGSQVTIIKTRSIYCASRSIAAEILLGHNLLPSAYNHRSHTQCRYWCMHYTWLTPPPPSWKKGWPLLKFQKRAEGSSLLYCPTHVHRPLASNIVTEHGGDEHKQPRKTMLSLYVGSGARGTKSSRCQAETTGYPVKHGQWHLTNYSTYWLP